MRNSRTYKTNSETTYTIKRWYRVEGGQEKDYIGVSKEKYMELRSQQRELHEEFDSYNNDMILNTFDY